MVDPFSHSPRTGRCQPLARCYSQPLGYRISQHNIMKSQTSQHRPYQEVGALIRNLIVQTPYNPGDRLPPEREIAEMLDVTRTVVREALIMLEIKGLVEVRRGAGIYVLDNAVGEGAAESADINHCNDAGPFELLQARQLLESNIAEFAACRQPGKISSKCARLCSWKSASWPAARRAAPKRRYAVSSGHCRSDPQQYAGRAVQTVMAVAGNNPMWIQLHRHLGDTHYRQEWLVDQKRILAALIKKRRPAANLPCGSIWKTSNAACWSSQRR